MRQKIKKGLTLIETLFVLGIFAIVLGIIFVVYSQTENSTKTANSITEIQIILETIKTLSSSTSNYNGLTDNVLAVSGLIPQKFVNNGAITNPWGGQVTIIPFSYTGSTNNNYIAINFYDLPKTACEKIGVTSFASVAQSLTVTGMQEDSSSGFSPGFLVANCIQGSTNYVNIRLSK